MPKILGKVSIFPSQLTKQSTIQPFISCNRLNLKLLQLKNRNNFIYFICSIICKIGTGETKPC